MQRTLRCLLLSWLLSTFLMLCVASVAAQGGGRIGIYPNSQGICTADYPCFASFEPFVPGFLYVIAVPDIANTSGGVNGAEYSVQFEFTRGEDALLSPIANPAANLVLGDPVGSGVNIAFPTCQVPDAQGSVLLHTISVTVLDANDKQSKRVWVAKHDTPSNPNFACPLINACDAPQFTAFCVIPTQLWIDVITAVETEPWTAIKALYR